MFVADLNRRALRLQTLTIVWMTVECVVALGSAWTVRSPILLGFGGDSAIELLSGFVVFRRFRSQPNSEEADEKLAARLAGALLLALALFIVLAATSALLRKRMPRRASPG